ncbi:efflux RND transporter periplasmic adaptor subunit [Pararhizobium sp. A13]|uniref:efflux RND transporter periplasmic adaptor subunit n=1 Tax=Pararhizobium sp. A13 TaxID=3133975 RepID=UPI00324DEDBE
MNTFKTALTLLPLSLFLLSGCEEKEEPAHEVVRPVLSQIVSLQPVAGSSYAGTVQPKVQTALGFRVIGRLVARNVDTGDMVTRGEPLAALDPTAFELAIRSARADLASAEATLANATAAEERMRTLLKTDVATQATVESAEQSREAALAGLVRARTGLSKAEEQLSYTQIKSEYDGVVTSTGAEVGQVVSAGETIVTVARPDDRDAVVDVPDGSALLPVGTVFSVSLQINPEVKVNGKVREIAPAADAATRTRRVKIALENPPPSFRLGTTITATLADDAAEQIVVPQTAIIERDGKSYVWIVDQEKQTVSARDIGKGTELGRFVVVTSGLEPGMRIVTAGTHSLEEGQKVKFEDGARS